MLIGTKNEAYQRNVLTIKSYGHKQYRVSLIGVCKAAGWELISKKFKKQYNYKLSNNLSRTRQTVQELALCNEWEYFFTGTLNQAKYNRYDLQKYIKDLSQFIQDKRKQYNSDIKYLLIPEKHKDGAWHIHGLLSGISEEKLQMFEITKKLPYFILNALQNGISVFDWRSYSKKFGYCSFSPVRDSYAITKYITKYITKDMLMRKSEKHKKLFYCSHGLQRAETILKECVNDDRIHNFQDGFFTFSNEYCRLVDLAPESFALKYETLQEWLSETSRA